MLIPKSKILIYGSCVSRDIQRITDNRFQLLDYIARQTFVSASAKPLQAPDTTSLTSRFLQRSILGDFTSNAYQRLIEHARQADAILIDLASERHGVVRYQGSLISRTNDLFKAGVLTPQEFKKHLEFNTPEHRKRFRAAALELKSLLMREKVFRKTIIIAAPFTDRSVDGSRIPLSHHKTASEINRDYAFYYRTLKGMGFAILTLPDHLCYSTPEHVWGLSQDHYIPEAYEYLADQIELYMESPTIAKRVFNSLNTGEIFK